jgi:hypothetical protein
MRKIYPLSMFLLVQACASLWIHVEAEMLVEKKRFMFGSFLA